METETETEKRVREYWASAYKNKNKNSIYNISSLDFAKNDDDELPFEPTAVLAKVPPNKPANKFSIYDISNIGFTT